MTGTVLVIGGTGELGAPVARQLRGDGYRVRLLARKLPAARDRHADLEYVEGDLDDTASLRSALAGWTAVVVDQPKLGADLREPLSQMTGRFGPAIVLERSEGP